MRAACPTHRSRRRLRCHGRSYNGGRRPLRCQPAVALITYAGGQVEQIRYEPYGSPFGIPAGDVDASGAVDGTDMTAVTAWYNAPSYDVRGDLDMDGDIDTTDLALLEDAKDAAATLGLYLLSTVDNRKGYAGYELLGELSEAKWDVRNRVLNSRLGRWGRRDPMGYVDGLNVYLYASASPALRTDPSGTDDIIPACPFEEPDPTVIGDGWVPNPNAWPATNNPNDDHCGQACYRSVSGETRGGQQCCYDTRGYLNTNPQCMGTIDLWGVCYREGKEWPWDGWCFMSPWRLIMHRLFDVNPWLEDPVAYNEAHCCMRSCGVPSGTQGIGITDGYLARTWSMCRDAVARGLTFCNGPNDCDDAKRNPPPIVHPPVNRNPRIILFQGERMPKNQ